MREIVLDTETTGLDPLQGHRIVEIGAIELMNHLPTGKTYHCFINPQREVPREAEAVHGISSEFLKDKPVFSRIADEFLAFISDTVLIIHNASFDVGFLNAELGFIKRPPILYERIIDTLALAKKRYPMGPNSLDALCKRYEIDIAKRTKHGALLDSELLAGVYLELIGGRQIALALPASDNLRQFQIKTGPVQTKRASALPPRLTEEERERHEIMVKSLGHAVLWKATKT
jgi:DNA polymerase III subunit epsilon